MGHKPVKVVYRSYVCLGPLPHLGDLVKVSAGQRDAMKYHV